RPARAGSAGRIPVVLDTDIGTDIDDTWALALLLALPELDLKLVVTDHGNTEARARVAAKFLQVSGRADVPVGIGKRTKASPVPQSEWTQGYDLRSYPGGVHEDGVGALIDMIMKSRETITLIVLGPAPNIREALAREPRIVKKARVFAMSGSVDVGYDGSAKPAAEYNVKEDPAATRAMYGAGWEVTIAPLDTAGTIRLVDERYKRILACRKPSVRALIENYRIWAGRVNWTKVNPEEMSSVLFDTLAVALVQRPSYCAMETVGLEVTDDGFTRRKDGGSRVRAALRWKDLDGYEEWLTARLTQ
ncbi:MAG: nucleoside hydrolase, partial [Acidobacteria bacterium]|nr:nucleoside hydrolase [Acidobacteriota bacterium]